MCFSFYLLQMALVIQTLTWYWSIALCLVSFKLSWKVYKVLTWTFLRPFSFWNLELFQPWIIFRCQNNSDPVKGQMIVAYKIKPTITIIIFMAIVCYHIWVTIKTSQFVKNVTRKPQKGVPQDIRGNTAQRLPNIHMLLIHQYERAERVIAALKMWLFHNKSLMYMLHNSLPSWFPFFEFMP